MGSSLQTRLHARTRPPVSAASSNRDRFETGRKVATHPCWRRSWVRTGSQHSVVRSRHAHRVANRSTSNHFAASVQSGSCVASAVSSVCVCARMRWPSCSNGGSIASDEPPREADTGLATRQWHIDANTAARHAHAHGWRRPRRCGCDAKSAAVSSVSMRRYDGRSMWRATDCKAARGT